MKFQVKDGRIKDCIQDEHGAWVTPKKGWLVASEDGTPMNGCKVYVEVADEIVKAHE